MPTDTAPTTDLVPTEIAKPRTLQEAKNRGAGVPMAQHGGAFLPAFTDVGQVMEFAALMSGAGVMVGKVCRGNPGACAAVIMMAGRFSLDPFLLSHKAYQTKEDAPMAWEAQAINAMIMGSGALAEPLDYIFEGEGLDRRVTVVGRLRGTSKDRTITTNTLANIKPQNSPNWKNEPDQQLAYYGSRLWIRRHAPHVLMGVYDREEVETIPGSFVEVEPGKSDPVARLQANMAAARPAETKVSDPVIQPNESGTAPPDPDPDPPAAAQPSQEPETDDDEAEPIAADADDEPEPDAAPPARELPPKPGALIRTKKGVMEWAQQWAAYWIAIPKEMEDAFWDETDQSQRAAVGIDPKTEEVFNGAINSKDAP